MECASLALDRNAGAISPVTKQSSKKKIGIRRRTQETPKILISSIMQIV
jgi:hypothetical protein